jgi:hypothetical protein
LTRKDQCPGHDQPLTPNLDTDVAAGFGHEWSSFRQGESELSPADRQAIFESYFRVFPWDELPANAVGIDVGCGSGRWRRASVICICLTQARRRLRWRAKTSRRPKCQLSSPRFCIFFGILASCAGHAGRHPRDCREAEGRRAVLDLPRLCAGQPTEVVSGNLASQRFSPQFDFGMSAHCATNCQPAYSDNRLLALGALRSHARAQLSDATTFSVPKTCNSTHA